MFHKIIVIGFGSNTITSYASPSTPGGMSAPGPMHPGLHPCHFPRADACLPTWRSLFAGCCLLLFTAWFAHTSSTPMSCSLLLPHPPRPFLHPASHIYSIPILYILNNQQHVPKDVYSMVGIFIYDNPTHRIHASSQTIFAATRYRQRRS